MELVSHRVTRHTHGADEKCRQNFRRETRGGDHSEDLGVDGKVIFERLLG